MKQPDLAGITAEAKRLSGVERKDAQPKSPCICRVDRGGDFACQSGIDEFALAKNQNPVVRRGIDRAIQLCARIAQDHSRREIGNHLFEAREMRRERLDGFGVDVSERDDAQLTHPPSRECERSATPARSPRRSRSSRQTCECHAWPLRVCEGCSSRSDAAPRQGESR